MPVFVRNLHLEYLVTDGALDADVMASLYRTCKWRTAEGAWYGVAQLPGGIEMIFRAVREGDGMRVLGTDTHLSGRCLWNGIPFLNVTPPESDSLSAVVACTNIAQDGVFVTHLVNAGVRNDLSEGESLLMQMVAFPTVIESFTSRESYEQQYQADAKGSRFPVLLTDQRIFPLNFMLNHDPDIPEEQRNQRLADDVVLVCGPVLAVRHMQSGEDRKDTEFIVATVATQFGHLDVAFVGGMVTGTPVKTGNYLVFSGILSGDVALEGHECWA
jgi:hypothetical protein